MAVSFEVLDGVGVARVQGALMVTEADAFRQSFSQWFPGAACRNVVIDLGKLEQLDSSGLGALVAATQQVRERGGELVFAALQKRPRLVFEITRFHRVCDIFDTVEEALRASR